ncbi:MAG: saccharopine dehydrogenase NADP-binding domain-containing protein, partial [Kiritimatiellia bacterium]|nr:saccharopine dehydrogenase NADP-binding domain-containing protein [Kiritimatiellia bacterium]
MGRVLIIGAGGVGGVVAHKCAQAPEVFTDICLASRTLEKCERIRRQLRRKISIAQIDADKPPEVVQLIRKFKPDIVLNMALPYQDLAIMQACLQTGVHYLDTANYEPPEEAKYSYKLQWAFKNKFRRKNIV